MLRTPVLSLFSYYRPESRERRLILFFLITREPLWLRSRYASMRQTIFPRRGGVDGKVQMHKAAYAYTANSETETTGTMEFSRERAERNYTIATARRWRRRARE